MNSTDVFVTGIGIISPAGCTTETTWSTLLAGTPCVRRMEENQRNSSSGCHGTAPADPCLDRNGSKPAPNWIAGQVGGFNPPAGTESADRVCQFAVAAACEAITSAGLNGDDLQTLASHRTRVSVGTSKGGILSFDSIAASLHALRRGTNAPALSLFYDLPPDAPARHVAVRFGITGGIHSTVAACATGTLAIIRAAQWIREGRADIVLAGSSDAALHPLWFGAFDRMGVLADAHPTRGAGWSCRPFDRSRQGFALGEGAAILVIESADSVRRRAVEPLTRIAGWAVGSDPAGLTQPTTDGSPLAEVIRQACDRAACNPQKLAAIHAHGTGTRINDLLETRAIAHFMRPRSEDLPIVSIKGAIGHLLGAAGAVEIATSVLARCHNVSPGNSTLLEPDPALGTFNLPRKSFSIAPGPILKTSLGFGGHLAAIVVAPA